MMKFLCDLAFSLDHVSLIETLICYSSWHCFWPCQRLLVVELLTISCEVHQVNELSWSNELYPGEFDDLSICNLYSKETCEPVPPRLMERTSDMPTMQFKRDPNQETLQVLVHGCLRRLISK